MTWRRAAESSIQAAIEQLRSYRQIGGSGDQGALPGMDEVKDLLALAQAVDPRMDTAQVNELASSATQR